MQAAQLELMKMDSVKRKVYTKLFSGKLKNLFSLRRTCFEKFVKEHFVESKPIYGYSKLKEAGKTFDATIVGSDQVWNSEWNGGIDKVMYLEFAPKNKRKIAYAASFGKNKP